MEQITIRKVDPTHLDKLLDFSRQTFLDAFFHLNKPEDIYAYVDNKLTKANLQDEINNPSSAFYFALLNGEVAGYTKLNRGPTQSDLQDDTSLEIERIYVSKDHQGKQIGKQLMDFAVQTAIENQLEYLWLGVWDKNHRAIKFYQQNGFEIFGSHDFMLGNDLQCDVLMRKDLSF
ncbi:GNAT family N-acetyltransferase [Mucilaginibacter boryungensis]|uniref:GNAT family N-acetyltransferase n=1 Tax=Mucilaginibacter boryungensis TaxID=768480 RepID=A0ABR9XH35_9SPHI|nr:GNAT family N-acetyltransferase [Mucilaginibacter boryungensis]MBE9666698.1 GNAT family N-acetyltransferase [Mucilaginibacter boryungensis]